MVWQVQTDQYIPEEDIYGEMDAIEHQLDQLEHRGVILEEKLRSSENGVWAVLSMGVGPGWTVGLLCVPAGVGDGRARGAG